MYLLKADSPILGSNPCPYVNEQANGLEPQPRAQFHDDRSVLSMPATSAGVTLGT